MSFSLQDKPRSNQMADSWFPTAVISHFYSAVYKTIEKEREQQVFALLLQPVLDTEGRDIGGRPRRRGGRPRGRGGDPHVPGGGLIGAECEDPDCRRYAKRLRREKGHLFTFLEDCVDYHNNISERGLRPFAASRKILYGIRSERGAERTKILMSVYET